jgi:hypothetical protein
LSGTGGNARSPKNLPGMLTRRRVRHTTVLDLEAAIEGGKPFYSYNWQMTPDEMVLLRDFMRLNEISEVVNAMRALLRMQAAMGSPVSELQRLQMKAIITETRMWAQDYVSVFLRSMLEEASAAFSYNATERANVEADLAALSPVEQEQDR